MFWYMDKIKNTVNSTFYGVLIFFSCKEVELRGVEPRSKQETNMVSTCLSVYWLSGSGWQAAADLNLIPLRVRISPGKGLSTILV